jgi:hypothetical protein
MPIIYSHQQIDRNPEPKHQQKYSNKSWVSYAGKQWQITGYSFDGGVPVYSLKCPTKDGLGQYATAHQRELSAPNTIAITESDRQANRERVLSEAAKYKRD